ncbi:hypothetical protein HYPSUDRAFT_914314 [Hypholoma sublateritium FD-334 SS-4]|uniref:Uncharacterized protein n=1 Tax=Hypholoma sublateritium (strain FD-334 SS-4) TaxID=945553 RepID=A0A0D2NIY5_HYPSF|nr:hypothetical protein HYPSUDRAFT_914314 [Hypholoma sublateritium FD-334 SS-4]
MGEQGDRDSEYLAWAMRVFDLALSTNRRRECMILAHHILIYVRRYLDSSKRCRCSRSCAAPAHSSANPYLYDRCMPKLRMVSCRTRRRQGLARSVHGALVSTAIGGRHHLLGAPHRAPRRSGCRLNGCRCRRRDLPWDGLQLCERQREPTDRRQEARAWESRPAQGLEFLGQCQRCVTVYICELTAQGLGQRRERVPWSQRWTAGG